ncbi:MDM32 (YOR147W) [Zygosaccharomyces parabailii]|uniref:Mitochondrial distribution and morphology protein 32 n=1 Tax=Zygosaccharomyces bailii (strain CLIB 213 / ATCC 58445 / CBS 680 / BCRC 21525 / NBRC 1098 / NCYC 1416 / NRRL Y-2227) TaxID=1333698 RepID=A0A8J2X8Z0_ZYGB2|nr:MDM32 (YOR147W) [Zygosaccharomyces parabailii]CDF89924.1 ZYBA0S05-04874g1_1 [Zygosaccharomyces bailii CLIB 213]
MQNPLTNCAIRATRSAVAGLKTYRPICFSLRRLHCGSLISNRFNRNHEEILSKNTDYLHVQNILLQKNRARMNKQKLLSEATNFYQRFKINTKWLLIRGNRPFSANEISTMFSWLLISQIAWIILGTTTFVSIILLIFNTVFAKEVVGKCIGKLLNAYLDGIDVNFQDALIPEWKKRCIRFNKVGFKTSQQEHTEQNEQEPKFEFDLKFHQIELSLNLWKWLWGNGLIQDLSVFGMRGEVTVSYAYRTNSPEDYLLDWFSNKEYNLGHVQITDSTVDVHDKQMEKSFKISIYDLDMPQLRFEWMIPDFFNANIVTGAINHSLFSIHKRQHRLPYLNELEQDLQHWKRITRLRLDSINVKDLGLNKSNTFNWVEDGDVEILADIMLPPLNDDADYSEQKNNKYMVLDVKFKFKGLKARFPDKPPKLSNGENIISLEELKPLISYINTQHELFQSFNDIRHTNAAWNSPNVSIKKNKSYPNVTVISSPSQWPAEEDGQSAMNQEIIKFHDQPSTDNNEIVLRCRIVKNAQELKNKIMPQETGVYDALSMELYVDLIKMVEEWEYRKKSDWMKLWGTTVVSQLILFGFGAMV